jgi:hypothetical protein
MWPRETVHAGRLLKDDLHASQQQGRRRRDVAVCHTRALVVRVVTSSAGIGCLVTPRRYFDKVWGMEQLSQAGCTSFRFESAKCNTQEGQWSLPSSNPPQVSSIGSPTQHTQQLASRRPKRLRSQYHWCLSTLVWTATMSSCARYAHEGVYSHHIYNI